MTQEQDELLSLRHRLGEELLSKRLHQQVRLSSRFLGKGRGHFHWENMRIVPILLKTLLRGLGLLERGLQNSLKFKVVEISSSFAKLPEAFDGYRILHLSDLHLDEMRDAGQALGEIVQNLEFDLCVITGDFRFQTVHDYDESLKRMAPLMKSINCPDGSFGVLGNHDFIEKVPGLERLGLRMLLNESIKLRRGADTICLTGIDDPHFYGTFDIQKACATVSHRDFNILLVHSPEVIEEAAACGVNLYLCGHTHAGQICLPGGIPIFTNSAGSREFSRGHWCYGGMQGYTSSGTGSSSFPVRFNCPPEITLHSLHRNH